MSVVILGERMRVATIRVALRPSEIEQLRLALSNPNFHIDVRMGQKNAQLIRLEDQK